MKNKGEQKISVCQVSISQSQKRLPSTSGGRWSMLILFKIGNVLFFAVYGLSLVVERMPDWQKLHTFAPRLIVCTS
ncbi:MAG: hypothetical protein PHU62_04340 [Bacteroidales bacterium]|nr:hypothetical protein [Bacteroidales bacterium]MDD4633790.1 hypothetical protein [Bacteroidales bacterium]